MVRKASLEKASKQWLKYKESADKAISEGNYELSESVLFAALTEAQDYFKETDFQYLYTLEKLVQSLWFLGRFDEAIEHCQKLVDIHEKNENEVEPVSRLSYTINLAMVYHAAREYSLSDACYDKATNLGIEIFGGSHVIVEKIMGLHADLLDKAGMQEKLANLGTIPKVITTSDWLPSEVLRMIKDSLGQEVVQPQTSSGSGGSDSSALRSAPPSLRQNGSPFKLPPSSTDIKPQAPPPPPEIKETISSSNQSGNMIERLQKVSGQSRSQNTPPPLPDADDNSAEEIETNLPPTSYTVSVNPGPGEIAVCLSKAEAEAIFLSNQHTARSNQDSGDIEVAVLLHSINLKLLDRLGLKNEMLLETIDALIQLKQLMGLNKEAVDLARSSFEIKKDLLSEDNIEVAHSANKLAGLYYSLGYLEEAVELSEYCLKLYTDQLGVEHASVASSLHNLATLYHVQKKYELAESKYKECLDLKNKIFGSNHPSTSRLLKSYAELLRETHREAEAEHMSTMAMGMITGSWKSITEEDLAQKDNAPAASGEAEEELCENCKLPTEGQATCKICGHKSRRRSTASFGDLK